MGKDSYQKFILRARRLYSKLLKQGYIMDRLNRDSGNGMVNKGILLNNMKYLSRNVKWHFEAGKVTVTWTSKLIRLYTNLWLWYLNLAFTESREVSMEYLWRVWHTRREHLPFRAPGSFFLTYAHIVEIKFPSLTWFFRLLTSKITRYFLDFAAYICCNPFYLI